MNPQRPGADTLLTEGRGNPFVKRESMSLIGQVSVAPAGDTAR